MPTRISSMIFQAKATLLQTRRGVQDVTAGTRRLPCLPVSDFTTVYPHILAESRTPLYSETSPEERGLQLGKAQNLRRALRRLHGTVLSPGDVFSFWKQVGRATRRRGFVAGRQLREGCLFPAIGGGLCQLSNALYDAALQAGCTIVERHAHTRIVPGSAAARDRDAAIAWNYIDLRFRHDTPLVLETRLTADTLIVRLRVQAQPSRIASDTHTHFVPLSA